MPENLKLSTACFTRKDGYFYTLDSSTDVLFKRTDDGTISYSYPLDSDLSNPALAIQHDFTYFYTMECTTAGNGVIRIKRWEVEDFILRLVKTWTLNGISTQKYDSNTFSIEAYERELATTTNSGSSTLTLDSNRRMVIGDILHLGPSTFSGDEGLFESVTILGVLPGNQVTTTAPTTVNFNSGDPVHFSNRCWFFNKFRPNDPDTVSGTGQLYSFDLNPATPTVIARKAGNEFRSVLASCFMKDPFYPTISGGKEFLVYANQTNLLFVEVDPSDPDFLDTVQSAAQNNQETNSAVIPIYDLAYEGSTIFRLQTKGTFRTGSTLTTEDWGRWNYQLSTFQRLPFAIGMVASPSIISADGVSTSNITATVTDQFDNPLPGRTATFSDDDTGSGSGFVNPTTDVSDSEGKAETTYTAGTTAKTVTITAET